MNYETYKENFKSLAVQNKKYKLEGNDKKADHVREKLNRIADELKLSVDGIFILESLCDKSQEDYVRLGAAVHLAKINPEISKRTLKEIEKTDSLAALEAQLILMSLFD